MLIQKYRLELVKESRGTYDSKLSEPQLVVEMLNGVLKLNIQAEEVFMVLCLDTKNKVIGAFEVSRGTINSSIVHPREIFKRALLCNAASIIVAHNHPSGEVTPSKEDISITDRLKSAAELMGIPLVDHLIVGESRYYSFKAEGLI